MRRLAAVAALLPSLVSPPAHAAEVPTITVFESTGASSLQVALDAIGLVYQYRTSPADFEVDLASGQYKVALIHSATTNITSVDPSIESFLDGGGRVVMFLYGVSVVPAHSLWATMGADWEQTLSDPPAAIEKIETDHPIFNVPNVVGALTANASSIFADNGDEVSLLSRGRALARTSGGGANDLLIVLRHDGHSILNTFLPADFTDDPDLQKLVRNEIVWAVDGIHMEPFDVYPSPFDTTFSPVLCTGCLADTDYFPGPGSCYCDGLCIASDDCCYDACRLCGRCRP
jgi:hypothetical protein